MKELGLSVFNEKVYGNYRGVVVDNNDPDQKGQIKVKVLPLFNTIANDSIPWARPAFALFSGSGTGTGSFAIPEVGSMVWVFFEAGDIYQPVYFAEACDDTKGLPSERTTNYPKRRVLKTSGGIVIYVDDKDGEVKIKTKNNYYIRISDKTLDIILETAAHFKVTLSDLLQMIKFETPNQLQFILNDVTQTAGFYHPSGAEFSIDTSGNVKVKGTTVNINPTS